MTATVPIAMLVFAVQSYSQTDRESTGLGAPAGGPATPYVNSQDQQLKIKFFNGKTIRIVNGKFYDALSGSAWQSIQGEVYQKEDGILFMRDYSGIGAPSKFSAITNYDGNALADQNLLIFAMRVGTYDMGGRPIALYDCGTPYTPPPPTTEQIKAAQEAAQVRVLADKKRAMEAQTKAVLWLQSQATNGDASAQCSLGEHYLAGIGCETNREKGVYWLKQATAQGNIEASNKLASLAH